MNEYTNNTIQQSPETEIVMEPASAVRRITACFLNCFFTIITILPFYVTIVYSFEHTKEFTEELAEWAWLLSLFIPLFYVFVQIVMISASGQSLGKKVMKIRLLKTDGTNPGFIRAVLIREFGFILTLNTIFDLISGLVFGTWYVDGATTISQVFLQITFLVCVIMLFNRSKNRRTLQDYFAKTIVVKLPDNQSYWV
ncbi:RDD family protein [Neisseria zalophi]|uniref:RDD family protein n=1 Tax=Neisseria zalophi TaxID=640030 RepID=A0A5J6PWA1_9NEIS|nr:RDD family protein [Neisseria zalophi]QEY25187.1 RDD family protein [Neisseria zalophi]